MQPLDREASTAAAATFAVGLAAGWLIHRHADDIKGAASKVSGSISSAFGKLKAKLS